MKFNNILKFLVIVLVLSLAIAKRVKKSRSTTLYEAATQLDKKSDVKTDCMEWGKNNNKVRFTHWLVLYTDTVKNGKSGFVVRNYWSSQNFSCAGLLPIAKRDSQNTFFVPYRNLSNSNEAEVANGGLLYMRRLTVYLKTGYINMNVEKGLFTDIELDEAKDLKNALTSNKDDYMRDVKNRRSMMGSNKVRAENLAWNKQQNINTQAQLDKALADKKTELAASQQMHKEMSAKAEQSRILIRGYKKEQQLLVNNDLKSLNEELQNNLIKMNALLQQQKDIDDRIKGIKPIDHNDLAESKVKLSTLLTTYANTFIESDPKSAELKDLIANLGTQMGKISTKIQ